MITGDIYIYIVPGILWLYVYVIKTILAIYFRNSFQFNKLEYLTLKTPLNISLALWIKQKKTHISVLLINQP